MNMFTKVHINGVDAMTTMGQRIKEFREHVGISQSQLGRLIGCGKSFVSAIENDKSKPTIEHLVNLLVNYGVNINYILIGEGNMFIPKLYKDVRSEILSEVEKMLQERGL